MKYFDLLPYLFTVVFAKAKDFLSLMDLLPFVSERINVMKTCVILNIFLDHGAHLLVGHGDRRE